MSKQARSALVTRVDRCVAQLRNGCPFSLGGAPISKVNREIFARCLESWLFLIEDLMMRQGYSEASRLQRAENFVSALLSADVTDTLRVLEICYSVLIDRVADVSAFKQRIHNEVSEEFPLGRLLSPINGTFYSALTDPNEEHVAQLMPTISQFLRYPRKLEFQDIGLESEAISGYLETEEKLAAVTYDKQKDLLHDLSDIIVDWFGDFHIDLLLPSHGPGSVAEGPLVLAEKFRACRVDALLRYVLDKANPELSHQDYFPGPVEQGLDRCSRTVFVPKTATKLRTISMEPAALQYIQQGVMHALYAYIKRHPYLGYHVKLSDQGQNQHEACVGSRFGVAGTLDLSAASDSVSWSLVKSTFQSVPSLFKWLSATRSRETLMPDGIRLQLKKFAPMGSALCFPIQCILFSAVVERSLRRAARRATRFEPFWSVYGDDIIVPSHIYEAVINDLESLGFTVNTSKSYNTGVYRESCGKEYYAGKDITPLYYRTPFYRKRVSPSAYGSWCSSANNAEQHRLPLYRLHLISKCLANSRRYGPYFVSSRFMAPYLFSEMPTNFHVRKKWNSRYQRWEGRFTSVISRPRSEELTDDTLRYFCRLVDMAKRSSAPTPFDEPSLPMAMQGSVEKFSSATLPITPFSQPWWLEEQAGWSA